MKTNFTLLFLLALSLTATSQIAPQLSFSNPTLISGTALQNGAKYRFPNVTMLGSMSLDAIVEIRGRSASDVVITNIDSTGVGWNKAFQPSLGIRNVGANREWWVEFRVEFVRSGSNSKEKIETFFVTTIDIDGDNGNLSEWAEMNKVDQTFLSSSTSLSTTLLGSVVDLLNNVTDRDFRVNGPTTNFTNIDTSATTVMATCKYIRKDRIDFKLGGKTNANGGSPGDVGIRMNSLWFKEFTLAPALSTLPLDFTSFSAMLVNNTSKVALKWTTEAEKNVNHFVIERSTDGKNFTDAGIVFAVNNTTGTTSYSFNDNNATSYGNTLYYRVHSVDLDGTTKFTAIRIIRVAKQTETIAVLTYPNPVTNELRVTIPNNWQDKKVVYEVINTSGVSAHKMAATSSSQTESMDISKLSPGMYVVKVSCGSEMATRTIIKK